MEITEFKIIDLPNPLLVIIMIDGEPVVKDQYYLIEKQSSLSFERKLVAYNKYLKISFDWKAKYGDEESESHVTSFVEWLSPVPDQEPESSNKNLSFYKDVDLNLLEVLPLNESVQKIRIENVSGGINRFVGDHYIEKGVILSTDQLAETKLEVRNTNEEEGVLSLGYKVGADEIIEDETYQLVIEYFTTSNDPDPE